jgi:HD superfamily phosphohydrolase
MRELSFIFILLCYPYLVFTQTRSDYDKVADKLMRYYNSKQSDSFYALFSNGINRDYIERDIVKKKMSYGSIIAFRYWLEDTVFNKKMVFYIDSFNKSYKGYYEHPIGISLDKNNKISNLRWFRNNHPNLGE